MYIYIYICICTFPEMPCMKEVYKDKWASVHWSAARNEERSSSRGWCVDPGARERERKRMNSLR